MVNWTQRINEECTKGPMYNKYCSSTSASCPWYTVTPKNFRNNVAEVFGQATNCSDSFIWKKLTFITSQFSFDQIMIN